LPASLPRRGRPLTVAGAEGGKVPGRRQVVPIPAAAGGPVRSARDQARSAGVRKAKARGRANASR
jgi:hypothetical protein